MPEDRISFRPVSEGDILFIKEMMNRTWEFDAYTQNTFTVDLILSNYLKSLLDRSNYGEMAICNNGPVGFLFGRCDTVPGRNFEHLSCSGDVPDRTVNDIGWDVYRQDLMRIRDADDLLIKDKEDSFEGELTLLMIDDSYRKNGIGRVLLNRFMRYLAKNNAKKAYLFTDDYCNFAFYSKIGFRQEDTTSIDLSDGNDRKFFLYSFHSDVFLQPAKRQSTELRD
ncbi:MAG: GNAT family N-acetyltransferase [Candidatus Methanomethylophilaceae archaeon]